MLKTIKTGKPLPCSVFKLDEIGQLVFGLRKVNITPEGNVHMLDYILGKGFILGKSVPPEIMAKVMLVALSHARMAFDHLSRDMKCNTIGRLLNDPVSERVTPRQSVQFCRGLSPRRLVYMSLETKVIDGEGFSFGSKASTIVTGDYIVLTDTGVYRWIYEYRPAKQSELSSLKQFKKNLTSKARSVPMKCEFIPMTEERFMQLFTVQPELFMNLIHRVNKQVDHAQLNLNRISANMQEQKDCIWRIFSKLSYR